MREATEKIMFQIADSFTDYLTWHGTREVAQAPPYLQTSPETACTEEESKLMIIEEDKIQGIRNEATKKGLIPPDPHPLGLNF